MPRGPRRAAAGVLHHAMVWGPERRAIFRDDWGRQDFPDRFATFREAHAIAANA